MSQPLPRETADGQYRELSDLLPALAAALAEHDERWSGVDLAPLPDKGLAHHHVALTGCGVLARIPKQSQLQLDAVANLAYQAACFERASASGHAPRLHAVLTPSAGLPRGALLVDHIDGRAAVLPHDLPAIITALAGIHSLPLPTAEQRPPIWDDVDPLAALAAEIGVQAGFLDAAALDPRARGIIDRELARLDDLVARGDRPIRRLISFDAHPGNFLVRPDGGAVLVDLEKCRYSYPSLDLAHATLYTSTTWEQGISLALTPEQVASCYAVWAAAVDVDPGSAGDGAVDDAGDGAVDDADRDAHGDAAGVADQHADAHDADWHLPLRRAMWLWSVTWCAKWRVLSDRDASATADGEDWSAARSEDALTAHVRGRVDDYLDVAVIRRLTDEFDAWTG